MINEVTTRSFYPYEDEIYDEDEEAEWLQLIITISSCSRFILSFICLSVEEEPG